MRDQFVSCLSKSLESNPDLYFITADLGFGVFEDIFARYPQRAINCGVCEQLMASMACGLASIGAKVIIYSIGPFPTLRCLEQIRNDILYHSSSVLIVSSGAGYSYGPLGISHHCTEDIASMRSLPGILVASPCSSFECQTLFDYWYNRDNTVMYLRLDKTCSKSLPAYYDAESCISHVSDKVSNSTAVLVHGGVLSPIESSFDLSLFDDVSVFSVPLLVDTLYLRDILESHTSIVTIEEHNLAGGFGSWILEVASLHKLLHSNYHCIAIPNTLCSVVGSQAYLRELCLNPIESLRSVLQNQ